MQELIKDLLLVTLGCGMGIITMCVVQAGKLADEKMERKYRRESTVHYRRKTDWQDNINPGIWKK